MKKEGFKKRQLTYERTLTHSYLVLETGAENVIPYQLFMLEKNKIKGLLECKVQYIDLKKRYLYDISSKQPLREAFSIRKLTGQELKSLLYGLWEVMKELEKYLLDSNGLLLSADVLYWDLAAEEAAVVYNPEITEEESREALLRLAEDLLELISHEEEQAVDLAYRLYDLTRETHFTWNRMIEYIEEKENMRKEAALKKEQVLGQAENHISEMPGQQPLTEQPACFEIEKNTGWKKEEGSQIRGNGPCDLAGVKKGFFKNVAAMGASVMGIRNRGHRESESLQTEWQGNPGKKQGNLGKAQGNPEKALGGVLEQTEGQGNPQEDDKECLWGETVCLAAGIEQEERRLEGKVRGQEISILLDSMPFVIGKMKGHVSHVLSDLSVSRIHAKFQEKDGSVWISDLNSKNGTYKNGVRIEVGEELEIRPGDEIRFGKLTFTYY